MFRNQMRQAREHVQAREYDAARDILKSIDDPQAREWERKIDELEAEHQRREEVRQSQWSFILPLVLLGVVVIAGAVFLLRGILGGDEGSSADVLSSVTATIDPRPQSVPLEFPFPDAEFTLLWDRSHENIVHFSGYTPLFQETLLPFYTEKLSEAGYEVSDFSRNELVNLSFVGNGQSGTVRIEYDEPGGDSRVTVRIETDAE